MKQKNQTPRTFTNEFHKGQTVSIIRYRHGWLDGSVSGKITSISAYSCTVLSDDGTEYPIEHPRDIRGH